MVTNTAETKEQAPTLEDIGAMETRLADLELEADALEEREQQLTKQIADIHAAGTGSKKDLPSMTGERREARDERVDVLEAIAALKARIDTELEAACAASAGRRLAKIPKAYTALVTQYEQAVAELGDVASRYAKASVTVHETFGRLGKMRAERGALVDRFAGVAAGPALSLSVIAPARHEGVRMAVEAVTINFADHAHIATAMEKDEQGIRSRRSYKEASGTPGGGIIVTAGLRAWPDLTGKQQAIVDSRKADAEAEERESRRFIDEGERATARSGVLGAAG